jgi:hypothetical protein
VRFVADESADTVWSITVTARNGTIAALADTADAVNATSLSVSLSGTVAVAQAWLATVRYVPGINFTGTDTVALAVNASDPRSGVAGDALDIAVRVTSTPNVWLSGAGRVSAPEDSVVQLALHADSNVTSDRVLSLFVDCGASTCTVAGVDTPARTLAFDGLSLSNVRAALQDVRVHLEANRVADEVVSVFVASPTYGAQANVYIGIVAENDAPSVLVLASPSLDENRNATLGVLFALDDVDLHTCWPADADAAVYTAVLSAVHGTLSLPAATLLPANVTVDGATCAAAPSCTVSGPLLQVEAALALAQFAPERDFVGTAGVSLSLSDNGTRGARRRACMRGH